MPFFSATRRAFRNILPLLAAAALAALFPSCATVPEAVLVTDPAQHFAGDMKAYLRLSGRTARDIARALGQERLDSLARFALGRSDDEPTHVDRKSIDSILERARSCGLGLRWDDGGLAELEGAIVGNYSAGSLPVAFAMNGDWRKEDGSYIYKDSPLRVSSPLPGVIKLGTSPAAMKTPFQGAAGATRAAGESGAPKPGLASPGPASPGRTIPPRYSEKASRDFALWLDSPSEVLGKTFLGETFSLPVTGMLVSASRETGDLYVATIIFQLRDESQARTYRPIMRFLWTAVADRIFGQGTASFNALTQEDDSYVVRHMTVSLDSLAAILALK